MAVGRCSPQIPPAPLWRTGLWEKSEKGSDIRNFFHRMHFSIASVTFSLILVQLLLICSRNKNLWLTSNILSWAVFKMSKRTIYLRKTWFRKDNPLFWIFSFYIFIKEKIYCRGTRDKKQNKNVCMILVHSFLISIKAVWLLCFMKTIEFLYTSQQIQLSTPCPHLKPHIYVIFIFKLHSLKKD